MITENTQRLFLLNGNDAKLKERLSGIDKLSSGTEVLIVYSSKLPSIAKTFIDNYPKTTAL